MFENYLLHLLILVTIYSVFAAGLNLSIGFTGLLNLGHVAFLGIGAYTSALLALAGVPFFAAFIAAGMAAAFFAPLLILLTRKLSGDYLAVATLGFAFVAHAVFLNWHSVTRGPLGIPGIPRPEFFGIALTSLSAYLLFSLAMAALVFFFLHRLTTSRYGTLLGAVRDDEIGVAVLGKNVTRAKLESLVVAAFIAGVAGSMLAHYLSYIEPKSFYLTELILVLSIVIIGGLGSLSGTVVAAGIVVLLPEMLRFVALPDSVIGPVRQILYTLFIILILMYRPRGIAGTVTLD